MSAKRYIDRLRVMDFYIRTRNTGSPVEFASKLGMSERSLYEYIRTLKELGAPVAFCYNVNSYIYYKEGNLSINFSLNDPSGLYHIKGKGAHYKAIRSNLSVFENLTLLQRYCSIASYF